MKASHPFVILAPYLALLAFGATAAVGLLRHAGGVSLALRCILAFYLTYYLVRLCGSVLGVVPGAEPAEAPAAESLGPAQRSE
jgi:hypothetical protein